MSVCLSVYYISKTSALILMKVALSYYQSKMSCALH